MKKLLALLLLPSIVLAQPINQPISGGRGGNSGGGSATNVYLAPSGLATVVTNSSSSWTVGVSAATVGAVTSSNSLTSITATNFPNGIPLLTAVTNGDTRALSFLLSLYAPYLVARTNYTDRVEATNASSLLLSGGGINLTLGQPSGDAAFSGGAFGAMNVSSVITNVVVTNTSSSAGVITGGRTGFTASFGIGTNGAGGTDPRFTSSAGTITATSNILSAPNVISQVITQYVAPATRTNAISVLANGAHYFGAENYGQAGSGNDNIENGIQFMGSGWDGSVPTNPTSLLNAALPKAAIRAFAGWGGARYDNTTLHVFSQGDIRLEPNYSNPTNYGYSYMSFGNEDVGSRTLMNYFNGSIKTNGSGGTIPYTVGYGLALDFPAQSTSNSVTKWANPSIQGFGPPTNATPYSGANHLGQLYFWRNSPALDFTYPVYSFAGANLGGKMTDTGWEFYGTNYSTNINAKYIYAPANQLYINSDLIMGSVGRYSIVDGGASANPLITAHIPFIYFYPADGRWGTGFGLSPVGGGQVTYNMALTSHEFVDGNTDAVRVKLDLANNTNTFTGGLYSSYFRGNAAGVSNAVSLTAGANVTITPGADGRSYEIASSGSGGSQTPWTSTINAATFALTNAGSISGTNYVGTDYTSPKIIFTNTAGPAGITLFGGSNISGSTSAAGGTISIIGGSGGVGSTVGGDIKLIGGYGNTGTGGNIILQPGAGAVSGSVLVDGTLGATNLNVANAIAANSLSVVSAAVTTANIVRSSFSTNAAAGVVDFSKTWYRLNSLTNYTFTGVSNKDSSGTNFNQWGCFFLNTSSSNITVTFSGSFTNRSSATNGWSGNVMTVGAGKRAVYTVDFAEGGNTNLMGALQGL